MTDPTFVLVANAGDGTVSTFALNDGVLERLAVTEGLTGCSTFAIDASRDLVYAAVKGATPEQPAGIVTLSLDRSSGQLVARSRKDLPDGGMNYLALARGGTALLGASYGGGYGITCPVENGVVGEIVDTVSFPNLHSVLPSADGNFAYFVSLGADVIAQYSMTDDLKLVPLQADVVECPEGSGPRHLVFNTAQDAVYVLTEFSGEVLHFARNTSSGLLTLVESAAAHDTSKQLGHSVFGADPLAEHFIWGADLHLSSGGRHLWCSERTESTLGALSIDADGRVSPPQRFIVTETQPRGFAVSPNGEYLLATGERSTTVSLYAVHGDDLDLLQQIETGHGANWVRFV